MGFFFISFCYRLSKHWPTVRIAHTTHVPCTVNTGSGLSNEMFQIKALRRNKYLQTFQRSLQSAPQILAASAPPPCLAGAVTDTKLPLGYQNRELPKIVAALNGCNAELQIKALNTLIDTLKCTELLHEAIVRLNIVRRLSAVLCQILHLPNDRRTLLACAALRLIGKREIGASKIIRNNQLVASLLRCMASDGDAGLEAASVMEVLVAFPRMVVLMIEKGFLQKMKNVLETGSIENEHLYNVLAFLLQEAPAIGLQELYFEFLLGKLHLANPNLAVTLKCFAMLINCHFGQHLCDIFHVMPTLIAVLMEPGLGSTKTYEFAALALQNCTHSFESRMAAVEYVDLPDTLINHARTKVHVALQIYCLQCLRQITENYTIKLAVRRQYAARIRGIAVLGGKAREIKSKLLDWLDFQIFDECGSDAEASIK